MSPATLEATATPLVDLSVARSTATVHPTGGVPTAEHHAGVHRIGTLAITSLPIGVLLAILTTTDPDWWGLHFSQLGTFHTFSSKVFNSTVLFSGFFLAAYGVLIAVALPSGTSRRTSRMFRGSLISAGLHLTMVGMIPIPVSPVMHDLAATGLGLSFLAMVATSLGIRRRGRAFRRFTVFCVVTLAVGMVVLTAGFITLALFEVVAFTLMGIWLGVLPRALRRDASSLGARSAASADTTKTDAAADTSAAGSCTARPADLSPARATALPVTLPARTHRRPADLPTARAARRGASLRRPVAPPARPRRSGRRPSPLTAAMRTRPLPAAVRSRRKTLGRTAR